jgi:hypothetical protein
VDAQEENSGRVVHSRDANRQPTTAGTMSGSGVLEFLEAACPLACIEDGLAKADNRRSHLYTLIIGYVLERLFQRQPTWGCQPDGVV